MGPQNEPVDIETEIIFEAKFQPNPKSALDVLAFVLSKPEAFTRDPDDLEAVSEILYIAKEDAISQWKKLNNR